MKLSRFHFGRKPADKLSQDQFSGLIPSKHFFNKNFMVFYNIQILLKQRSDLSFPSSKLTLFPNTTLRQISIFSCFKIFQQTEPHPYLRDPCWVLSAAPGVTPVTFTWCFIMELTGTARRVETFRQPSWEANSE